MPPKRKSNGKAPPGKKTPKKARRASSSEPDRSTPEAEESAGFDKSKLQKTFNFNFEELMNDPCFNHPEFVHSMKPEELDTKFYENGGLDNPIHFRCDPRRLGMALPHTSFSVNDVLDLVGGNRMIEVVHVSDQGSVKMSLQEFVDFYNTPPKERKDLYNVLSLEFSLTPLEDIVKSPSIVREIDWVGNRWPDALRQRWISFCGREKKLYNPHHTFPKVQNYCLMSVANCYTDFHIDFSGTSVWYHVLKGRKVFWLIPPTETNFFIYQEFIKTVGDNAFFGKSVEKCHMAVLEPGDTMLIPAGWIHAVYTPDDSIVFGGNFLHSLSCKTQIRVYQVENKLNITRKFRLPYNEELLFYVIADYVKTWTGREYVRPLRIEDAKLDYVGEKWRQAEGHHRKIIYSDYETGVELTNDMIGAEEGSSKDEVKVIAMHAENTLFSTPVISVSKNSFTYDTGLEEEADEEKKYVESKEEAEIRRDNEIDELARTNPLVFYKNSKHDFVRNKCVPDHKLPIGHEAPICFKNEELAKITPRLLEELEALGTYMRRKGKVEVAEGICQPASLLNAFNTVLKKRRSDLEGKPFERPFLMPRRYTRSTMETGDCTDFEKVPESPPEDHSRRSSRFKVEDFPDELLEAEVEEKAAKEAQEAKEAAVLPIQPVSGPLEYIPTPIAKKNEEEVDGEEEDEEQEEQEDDDEEYEAEEYVPTARVTRRSSGRRATNQEEAAAEEPEAEEVKPKKEKKEKPKKEKKEKVSKEKRVKELEKRRRESELDAELRAAHGGGSHKSKKKKPEKPAFVGGLPTSAIQNDPVVSNPYNFDPKMEIQKLGTGQLKSAYRKTKANVELHIEKNLYKLEPKRGSHDDEEGSREQSEEPDHYPTYERPGNQPIHSDYSGQNNYDESMPPAKKSKMEAINVDTSEPSKRRDSREHRVYTPSSQVATPSPSISHPKPKRSVPSVFSPREVHERRVSDSTTPAMRKGVYMASMSRQDKMIAEGSPGTSSRHNSISSTSSERRPSFIPQLSNTSRHSSNDVYTPSAISPLPTRSSWLPDTSNISRHSIDDDSLIDVVNDSPVDPVLSPSFPTSITPPPVSLAELSNGRKSQNNHEEGKKQKIPAKEAMAELKLLVSKLNSLNEG